jgi:pimeloyl-ACP methyl ester carboxylesterase
MDVPTQSPSAFDRVNSERSEPWFVGRPGQEIFGWLHGRTQEATGRLGVVLCGTLGAESLSAHRAFRALAVSLAECDIPAFRFDYAGTGDSLDPDGGAMRLSSYVDSVRTAIDVMRTQTGIDRIVLVGVRLGALFAVKAAELEEVSGLVLWGPVVSGRRFVREWNLMARHPEQPATGSADETVNAAGFLLDKAFLDEVAAASLLEAKPLGHPDCLIVEREELAPEDKLVASLQALGLNTDRCRPGGFLAGVIHEPHLTELPVAAIHEMRDWIARRQALPESGSRGTPATTMTKSVVLPAATNGRSIRIRERFLDREAAGGLFGIVSEPADAADWNGQCVVLLNAGSVHHIGPHRMHVEFARRMAAEGSRVCRADLSGLGDSQLPADLRGNDPYPSTAVLDVGRIVRAVNEMGRSSRLALVGLCSGAWASFHGALAVDGITDIVLINPDFYGERSVVGKPASFVRQQDYSHYKRSARSWAKWKKLLSGRANMRKIARVLWNRAVLKLASLRTSVTGGRHQLDDDLTRLAVTGVRVAFIFSPGDGGLDFLNMNGRAGTDNLARLGLLREVTISDADHPFSLPGSQGRLGDTLSEWLRP